jgi:hypothetical protein
MANCSNSGLMLARPRLQNTWPREGARPRKAGRPSFAIMPTASHLDLFVVPTISFRQLYGLLVLRHSRRELLLGVRSNPAGADEMP